MSYANLRQVLAAVSAATILVAGFVLLGFLTSSEREWIANAEIGAAAAVVISADGARSAKEAAYLSVDAGVVIEGPASSAPGGRATWQAEVTNSSPTTATAVLVTVTLPVSSSLESMSSGGSEVSPGLVVWELGDLIGPVTRTVAVTGRISSILGVGQSLTARAEVSTEGHDDNLGNNVDEWQTTIAMHDLRPSISPSSTTARPSERLTYTIGLDNVSTVPADDVVLSVTLGAGLEWMSDTGSDNGFVRRVPAGDGDVIEYERARQNGPSSIDFEVITRVGAELDADATVTASVAVGSASGDESIGGRSESAPPITIVLSDLRLDVRGGELTALGSETSYRTYWSNEIGASARRVIMTATLPASVHNLTSTPPADLVDGTPIGPARLRWVLGPAAQGSGEMAGPEIVVGHDSAFGAGGAFTTSFEIWEGVRDANQVDNIAVRRTDLFSPNAARLEISVPPTMIVDTQGELRVLALDGREAWVADGTIARFEADAGTINNAMPTTVSGVATTGYRAPSIVGPVDIGVEVDDISAMSRIEVLPGLPTTVTPATESVSATSGTTVTFRVDVVDRFGNLVADGTTVRTEASDGNVEPLIAETLGGRSTFEWSAERAGMQSLSFLAGPPESEVSGVGIINWLAGPPARISLSAEPPTIGADGGLVAISAAVFDEWDNPVADGLSVQFASVGGSFARMVETTRRGLATATWTSGSEIGDIGITARVTREGEEPLLANVSVAVAPANLGISASISGPRGTLDDTEQIHPGELLSLTLGVHNTGQATARNVIVSARLPPPLLDVTATTAAGIPLMEPIDPPVSVGPDAWSVPDLAPGGEITVTVSGNFDRSYLWTGADLFFVRGAVTSTTPEASVSDLVRTAQVRVTSSDVSIGIEIDGSASTLGPGGRLVYEIGVGNLQPQTLASGGVITSTLPAGSSFDHWSIPSGASLRLEEANPLDADSRTLVWRVIGPVPLNSAFRVWLNIDGDVRGDTELITRVEISSAVHDIDHLNNDAAIAVRLPGGVNLIADIEGPSDAHPDEIVEHDLIVRNLARTEAAANVIVNSYLPPEAEIIDVAEPGRIVGPGRAQWQFERLGPGGRPALWIKWKVPVASRVGDTLAHRVEVMADGDDSNEVDNVSTFVTSIVPGPPTKVELTAEPSAVDTCPLGLVALEARVTDIAGNPVADGVEVAWTTTLGALDAPMSTTAEGVADAVLVADRLTGFARVRASSGPSAATVNIDLRPGPPADIALGVSPDVGVVGDEMSIRVALNDACGNPVADGTPVRINVSRGDLGGGALERVVPVDAGIASATLTVAASIGPLRIEASADGFPEVRAELFVRVKAPAPTARLIWLPYTARSSTAQAVAVDDLAPRQTVIRKPRPPE